MTRISLWATNSSLLEFNFLFFFFINQFNFLFNTMLGYMEIQPIYVLDTDYSITRDRTRVLAVSVFLDGAH